MPKVDTKSLRKLASKVKPSILTGAINESVDYIDELERDINVLTEIINQSDYSEELWEAYRKAKELY